MSAAQSHIELFTKAMQADGLEPDNIVTDDGILHAHIRDRQDKSGKKDLWYILHGDGIPAGSYGHYSRLPDGKNWQAKADTTLTAQERNQVRDRMEKALAARKHAQAEVHAACIVKSEYMLTAARDPDSTHLYISGHQITPYGARQSKDMLLIALRREKVLTGMQIIMPDGSKKFLTGTDKIGAYHVIKGKDNTVYFCEGWATGCTIHEQTGAIVLVCFDCGNLLAVAQDARLKTPAADFVICADNDRLTTGNPGLTKARAAAQATGARLAVPVFPGDEGTDFNDLFRIAGPDAVRQQIDAAALVEPVAVPVVHESKSLSCATPDILTDQRIKYYFANIYSSLVQYVPGIGWHYWDGRRWCTNLAGGLHVLIDQMQRHLMEAALSIADEEERMKRRKALLGLEMHSRQITVIQACQTVPALITESPALDKDVMLFNTMAGTVDLHTGNIRQHDPADMITRVSTIEYDAAATCPVFMGFITWAMCGDTAVVEYLQRFVGYCLTGKTTEQKLVFMYGLGKNGKTTLINVIQELLGDYSSNADTTLIMKSNNGSDGNRLSMLAGIRGARAVTLSEVNDGQQLDAAAIKSFTGGDAITCRHLYEGFFSYTPQAKLIGFGNYNPHVRDTDHGIWRRIDLVPFRATCADEDTDGDLPNKLRAELPGILAWAVRGCLDWQRIGLAAPDAIRSATNEYRQAEDIFASWLGECCGVSPHRTAVSTPLLESFKEFSGWRSTSHKKFGNMLTGHGFKNRKSNGKVYWDGLDLQISDDSDFRPPFSEKSHKKEDLKSFPEYPPKGHYGHCSPFFDGEEFHIGEGDVL